MASQLGPLEVCCDAPPYAIVKACHQIGLQTPADVRWCRLSQQQMSQGAWRHFMQFAPWNVMMPADYMAKETCSCGALLPKLEHYIFTLDSHKELSYLLAQCERCLTVYWEQTAHS